MSPQSALSRGGGDLLRQIDRDRNPQPGAVENENGMNEPGREQDQQSRLRTDAEFLLRSAMFEAKEWRVHVQCRKVRIVEDELTAITIDSDVIDGRPIASTVAVRVV